MLFMLLPRARSGDVTIKKDHDEWERREMVERGYGDNREREGESEGEKTEGRKTRHGF